LLFPVEVKKLKEKIIYQGEELSEFNRPVN